MSAGQFHVRVTKDQLVFSAAHFITFDGVCERLHGHNWRTAVEVGGPLDSNHYVYDFIALRDALQQIVNRLDHRMLLPTAHPAIFVETRDSEVEARYQQRRWVFPAEECVLLPVANTTAELIAAWIGRQLIDGMAAEDRERIDWLSVAVEENFGQWATCRFELAERRSALAHSPPRGGPISD